MKNRIAVPISENQYQNSYITSNYGSIDSVVDKLVDNIIGIINTNPQEKIAGQEKGSVVIAGLPYDFTISTNVEFRNFIITESDFTYRTIHVSFSFFYDDYQKSYTINRKRVPGVLSDTQDYGNINIEQNKSTAIKEMQQYKLDLKDNLRDIAPKILQYQIKPTKN